jgi:hypothetical protein
VTAADIISRARSYLGCPLRHQGRYRAFDCVGLLLAVAEEVGALDVFGVPIRRDDYTQYGPQPLDGFVLGEVRRRLLEIPTADIRAALALRQPNALPAIRALLSPADVLVLSVPRIPCHVAFVTRLGTSVAMLHAYSGADKVVEHLIDDLWLRRVSGVFRFPEVLTDG